MQSLLANIPAVDQILKTKPIDKLLAIHSSALVKKLFRQKLVYYVKPFLLELVNPFRRKR
ncbi:hypothetical protein GQR36_15270 [Enterococcus termitis]